MFVILNDVLEHSETFCLCRILQGELKRLKWQHAEVGEGALFGEVSPDSGGSGSGDIQSEELLSEARILRHHKNRLETRMQILEDHNKQLESQLHRLRELLLQVCRKWTAIQSNTFFILSVV